MNARILDDERLETAGQWLLQLESKDSGQQELAQWLEWYGADVRNREAFEHIQATYESMRALPAVQREALAHRAEGHRETGQVTGAHHWFVHPRRWLAAAAVMAAIGVPWAWWQSDAGPRSAAIVHTAVYYTERAAHRVVSLPDGSEVRLGAASSVSLNYTDETRYLVLEGGEAYFEVARDATRPFIVQAGSVRVRAVGTAFNVRRADQRVVVIVSDGAVDVANTVAQDRNDTVVADEAARRTVHVRAGEQVTLDSEHAPPSLAAVDAEAALAWQSGRLEFVNEPLPAVVATVNRYSARKLVLADRGLDALTYTGTVENGRIEEWLQALEEVFPLQITAVGGQTILLQQEPK